MSIASEITRLYGVRSDIFTAITNKGVTVPSGSQLDDAPTLIGSISGGGGGGAYTLDYTNPNLYCTFGSNPNCARSGATITPVYTLTNNYVLDNLTLNGNNIQGSSFTMPATDSIVGMVVHQIVPIKLRIAFDTLDHVALYNLRYKGNVPTLSGGIYHWGNDNRDVELTSSELNGICDQYSPYIISGRGNGSYIELSFNFGTFDTTTDYFTWSHNYTYANLDFTATVRSGNTVLVTETYNYPGGGSQLDVRIPELATPGDDPGDNPGDLPEGWDYCPNCGEAYDGEYCGSCGYPDVIIDNPGGDLPEGWDYCPNCGVAYDGVYCGSCGYPDNDPGGDLPEGWDYCPNCGEAYDGVYCGSCGYPDNEDPGDNPYTGGLG